MKKIKIKYKLLLSGFPSVSKEYKFHDLILKEEQINDDFFIDIIKSGKFNTGLYLSYCTLINKDKKAYINYFESYDFTEIEIQNKLVLDKNKLTKLIEKYPIIVNKIDELLTELRLTLNIPVSIPIKIISFYNENDEYIDSLTIISNISFWNRISYIDSLEFANNSRFHIELKYFYQIDNTRYKRALLFFNESFDSNKSEIRFINLVSCLESLFNYNLTKEESITKRVSSIIAGIFSIFNDKYDEYYDLIKKIYNKRSRYLHGDNNAITMEDEKILRKITRIVLILYSIVIMNKKYTTKEMINYLSFPKKIDIQHKMLLKALFAKSFHEQQSEVLNVFKEEFGNIIPNEIEEKIKQFN